MVAMNVSDPEFRYLFAATSYHACSDLLTPENLPENRTLADIVQGLAYAHKAYLEIGSIGHAQNNTENVYILFVVQPNERNIFDQRPLEYELLQTHGIRVIRRTFDELEKVSRLSDDNRTLLISTGTAWHPIEISVVYYRAGYAPTDYPSHRQFETRKLIERSRAIKCPSLALQLAGSKKVQAVLSRPGVVESFLLSDRWQSISQDNPHPFTSKTVDELKDSWMEMWGLEERDGVEKARRDAPSLVLKPQREGGGNNVYKLNIPAFLDKLPEREKEAWIAMALIHVPKGIQNFLVRTGVDIVKSNVVSELGIFGWALFGYDDTKSRKLRLDEGSGGYLLRTKGEDSDEGGVATGFSVLDSIILVD
jgi:glutathione synthetase